MKTRTATTMFTLLAALFLLSACGSSTQATGSAEPIATVPATIATAQPTNLPVEATMVAAAVAGVDRVSLTREDISNIPLSEWSTAQDGMEPGPGCEITRLVLPEGEAGIQWQLTEPRRVWYWGSPFHSCPEQFSVCFPTFFAIMTGSITARPMPYACQECAVVLPPDYYFVSFESAGGPETNAVDIITCPVE